MGIANTFDVISTQAVWKAHLNLQTFMNQSKHNERHKTLWHTILYKKLPIANLFSLIIM